MSYGLSFGAWAAAFLAIAAVGCAAPLAPEEVSSSEAALGEAATLTFDDAWNERASGELRKGSKVRVAYDAARLTTCRGELNGGGPGWAITGFWKIGDGPVKSFEAGGHSATGDHVDQDLTLDASGDLQIWFQNTSRWGCSAFDSNSGDNYHFTVLPSANEPGWVGNVRYATDRMTCDGVVCESSLRPVNGDIAYDTWARQRAAIRVLNFEVWKDGVTNWDNPDRWKQLDVQVHARIGSAGPFQSSYVSFDRRLGNNARYAIDLRALDPIAGNFTIQNPNDCPNVALEVAGNGAYVEAIVELYATVNGVDVRPSGGESVYRVRYTNDKGLYEPCVH